MDSSSFIALFLAIVVLIIVLAGVIIIAVLIWPGKQKSMEESRKRREAEEAERQREYQEFVDEIENGILPLVAQNEIGFDTYQGEYVFYKYPCRLEMDVMVTDMVGGSYEVTDKTTAGALHAEPHLEQRTVDSGDLYYTNYRWVFLGQHKTYSINGNELVREQYFKDSVLLAKLGEDSNLYFITGGAENIRLVRNYVVSHRQWTPEYMQTQLAQREASDNKAPIAEGIPTVVSATVEEAAEVVNVEETVEAEAPKSEPAKEEVRDPESEILEKAKFMQEIVDAKESFDELVGELNNTQIKMTVSKTKGAKIVNREAYIGIFKKAKLLEKKTSYIVPPSRKAASVKRRFGELLKAFCSTIKEFLDVVEGYSYEDLQKVKEANTTISIDGKKIQEHIDSLVEAVRAYRDSND